jgi:gluconate 2-dehydrogenase gamma chain
MEPKYPPGTVRHLLDTDLVTPPTRAAIRQRLANPPVTTPRFLDTDAFATLQAVCSRLIPQPARAEAVDLAGPIDTRLADNQSNGWRYDHLPPDRDAILQGLQGIDEAAEALFGTFFRTLDSRAQDQILLAVQRGEAPGPSWRSLDAPRFFEELLAEVAEIYYSHPLAQEEIGYVGMADAHGWQAIGLNELAPHEPRLSGNDLD